MSSNSDTNNTLKVARLQKIMSALNLRQSELATKLNISRQYVNNVYHGRENLSEEKLIEFAKIYNVNLDYYFTGRGEMFLNYNTNYINKTLKEKNNLTDADLKELEELLRSNTTRQMILNFIEVKKGDKKAIETLIHNLNGIKAAYEFLN